MIETIGVCWCLPVCSLRWWVDDCSRGGRTAVWYLAFYIVGKCCFEYWKWHLENWWSVYWLRWRRPLLLKMRQIAFWYFPFLSVKHQRWPDHHHGKEPRWYFGLSVEKGGNSRPTRTFRHHQNCPIVTSNNELPFFCHCCWLYVRVDFLVWIMMSRSSFVILS